MPAFWTEDPSIGNALAGLADSFSGKSQVAMASTIEDIKQKRMLAEMRRQAQQRNQEMWNARSPDQVLSRSGRGRAELGECRRCNGH